MSKKYTVSLHEQEKTDRVTSSEVVLLGLRVSVIYLNNLAHCFTNIIRLFVLCVFDWVYEHAHHSVSKSWWMQVCMKQDSNSLNCLCNVNERAEHSFGRCNISM